MPLLVFYSFLQKGIYKSRQIVYNIGREQRRRAFMKKQNAFRRVGESVRAAERSVARAIDNTQKEFKETVQAVRERDPAARSTAEILLLYSGVHAIMAHRLAHNLQ